VGWNRFFRRRFWHEERSRELEAHLQIETDENIARGLPPDEARYAAQRRLGNLLRIREEIYAMNSVSVVDTLWQDLRYGARQVRHNPAFAVLTLLRAPSGWIRWPRFGASNNAGRRMGR
jgi:hypothetical protein